jgi:hypothetical protein
MGSVENRQKAIIGLIKYMLDCGITFQIEKEKDR